MYISKSNISNFNFDRSNKYLLKRYIVDFTIYFKKFEDILYFDNIHGINTMCISKSYKNIKEIYVLIVEINKLSVGILDSWIWLSRNNLLFLNQCELFLKLSLCYTKLKEYIYIIYQHFMYEYEDVPLRIHKKNKIRLNLIYLDKTCYFILKLLNRMATIYYDIYKWLYLDTKIVKTPLLSFIECKIIIEKQGIWYTNYKKYIKIQCRNIWVKNSIYIVNYLYENNILNNLIKLSMYNHNPYIIRIYTKMFDINKNKILDCVDVYSKKGVKIIKKYKIQEDINLKRDYQNNFTKYLMYYIQENTKQDYLPFFEYHYKKYLKDNVHLNNTPQTWVWYYVKYYDNYYQKFYDELKKKYNSMKKKKEICEKPIYIFQEMFEKDLTAKERYLLKQKFEELVKVEIQQKLEAKDKIESEDTDNWEKVILHKFENYFLFEIHSDYRLCNKVYKLYYKKYIEALIKYNCMDYLEVNIWYIINNFYNFKIEFIKKTKKSKKYVEDTTPYSNTEYSSEYEDSEGLEREDEDYKRQFEADDEWSSSMSSADISYEEASILTYEQYRCRLEKSSRGRGRGRGRELKESSTIAPDSEAPIVTITPDSEAPIVTITPDSEAPIVTITPDSEAPIVTITPDSEAPIVTITPDSEAPIVTITPDRRQVEEYKDINTKEEYYDYKDKTNEEEVEYKREYRRYRVKKKL